MTTVRESVRPTTPNPYASICVRLWPHSDDESDEFGETVLEPAVNAVLAQLIAALEKMPEPFSVSAAFFGELCRHSHYGGTVTREDEELDTSVANLLWEAERIITG